MVDLLWQQLKKYAKRAIYGMQRVRRVLHAYFFEYIELFLVLVTHLLGNLDQDQYLDLAIVGHFERRAKNDFGAAVQSLHLIHDIILDGLVARSS